MGSAWSTLATEPAERRPSFALIDLHGDGLALSDRSYPVEVVLEEGGSRRALSWTAAERADAFVWRDRNLDGALQLPTELLIGWSDARSIVDQLRSWDLTDGNGDGRLDVEDACWDSLGLWIDRDHDGLPGKDELLSLGDRWIGALVMKERALGTLDGSLNLFESELLVELEGAGPPPRTLRLVSVRFAEALVPSG